MLSLSAFVVLTTAGCGSSDSSTTDKKQDNKLVDGGQENTIVDSSKDKKPVIISGKAVDGYLRFATVCLDLDNNGYCQIGAEPASSTREDGSYELNVTKEQAANPNFATANLIVFGGQDSDTAKDFSGKLVAPFDPENPSNLFITPLSTMVSAVQKSDTDLTQAQAQEKVASLLGLTTEQLTSDPVLEAKNGDITVLSKALELQKSVEVLAKAKGGDSKKATEAIYIALADGVKGSSENNQSVTTLLESANKAILGDAATKLADATTMAENVKKAVATIDVNSTNDANEITATALTIDNIKTKIIADDEDINFDDFVVTPDDALTELVKNALVNAGVKEELTQDQIDIILANLNGSVTIENLNNAMVSDGNFSNIQDQLNNKIAVEETAKQLENNYDASITAKTVLTELGDYWIDFWNYMYSGDIHMSKEKVEDGKFVDYEYNTTSDKFDIKNSYDDESEYKTIKLVDGDWNVESQSDSISFDADGNLLLQNSWESSKYSVSAFDASGLNIANVYNSSDNYDDFDMESNANFSEGAKYYKVLRTPIQQDKATFKPSYELYYWQDGYWDDTLDKYVDTDENANKETYLKHGTYSSFDEFISINKKNSDRYGNSNLRYSYYDKNDNQQEDKINFLDDTTIAFGYESESKKGTYKIETIDDKQVMLFSFDDEKEKPDYKNGYLLLDDTIREVVVTYNKDGEAHLKDNSSEMTYSVHENITTLDDFIKYNTKSENNYDSSLYLNSYNGNGSGIYYRGYFAENNVITFESDSYDGKHNLDQNGTYEIKTVGNSAILIIKPPVALQDDWMKNRAYTIYAVQDGFVREGEYDYDVEQYSEDYYDDNYESEFIDYNEIAVRDMYNAFKESVASSAKQAPAFKKSHVKKIDPRKERAIQKARKSREASLRIYRGF